MADKTVFLDTNGWVALLNTSDSLHVRAASSWRELGRAGYSVVLTDWILAETGNGLARTRARAPFLRALEAVQASERTRIVYVGETLLADAARLYASREDKSWGLVDCASFVVMQEQAVTEAFTNDHHFEQAGFRRLLPSA